MKFVKGISLFLVFPGICISLGLIAGFMLDDFFYPGNGNFVSENAYSTDGNTSLEYGPHSDSGSSNAVAEVALTADEEINADTEYVIEEYDTRRDTLIVNSISVPLKYLGMDREEFLHTMELYALSPPLSEQKRGFIGLEVRSFSEQRVVVRMNYAYIEPTQSFYIRVEDNNLVVYCDDEETVYMYTNIVADTLPGYVQTKVSIGMYVEDEESLYNFLETYSS